MKTTYQDKPTKGFIINVSGELLEQLLNLRHEAYILKIVNSSTPDYAFQVVCMSKDGFEIAEGNTFPTES